MLQNTNQTYDSLILGASLSVLETQKTRENTCFGDRRECKRTVLVGNDYENENNKKGPRGTPTGTALIVFSNEDALEPEINIKCN